MGGDGCGRRLRRRCEECGGGSLCGHGRVRSDCKECSPHRFCEHGRERRTGARMCKECRKAAVEIVEVLSPGTLEKIASEMDAVEERIDDACRRDLELALDNM